MGRLLVVSGPSCVGKGPLFNAFSVFYPDKFQEWDKLVLYNSRPPRPGEKDGIDYHFRTRKDIESLKDNDKFRVFEVRADIQALNIEDLNNGLADGNIYFEGNPFVGTTLLDISLKEGFPVTSIFLSPLSKEEILFLRDHDDKIDLSSLLAEIMRRKLLRRIKRHKTDISLKDLQDIEKRAGSAYEEIKYAYKYQFVIPNHDGEDSDNWNSFYYPLAEARQVLLEFLRILDGSGTRLSERWDKNLL